MTKNDRHDHDPRRPELELEKHKAELRDTANAILARELFERAPRGRPRFHTRGFIPRGKR